MLRHIFFDIDDTLFPSTEFSSLARRNAINAMISMGLDQDYEALNAKLSAIIRKKGSNYEHHFDDLCAQLGIKQPGRFIAAAVAAYHDTKTAIQPFPTVPLTLLKLKEKGLRLHVATNGNSIKQWDKLIRLRLALYFDDVFVSEELGGEKGPAFYRKVMKLLGARAEECLMVGDREEADITPAKSIGMHTVRFIGGKYASVASKADFRINDMGRLIKICDTLQRL